MVIIIANHYVAIVMDLHGDICTLVSRSRVEDR